MTPKKAAALSKRIDVMCDEPFMFACKVGSGCHASCKGKRDPQDYLTMILQLIDGVFDRGTIRAICARLDGANRPE